MAFLGVRTATGGAAPISPRGAELLLPELRRADDRDAVRRFHPAAFRDPFRAYTRRNIDAVFAVLGFMGSVVRSLVAVAFTVTGAIVSALVLASLMGLTHEYTIPAKYMSTFGTPRF
jgi:hypothetical protein